jgi:hypothetical protein
MEIVRMILDAGVKIQNGVRLHFAAGARTSGTNPHYGRWVPSRAFDTSRNSIMVLLVEHGADMNRKEESRHMIVQYAIVRAVMARVVEWFRWLLEHGANPLARGNFGSAFEYAQLTEHEAISKVVRDFEERDA